MVRSVLSFETQASINTWMLNLRENSRISYTDYFTAWYVWLQENSEKFGGMTPDDLIEYQVQTDGRTQYEILDTIQRYVNGLNWRYNSKITVYSGLRSFFMHNRAELPRDQSFRIQSDRPPVLGNLTEDDVKMIVLSSNPTYRAIFLSMFQAGLDRESFDYWNRGGWPELWEQISEVPGSKVPSRFLVKINLPGRKHSRNRSLFYSYIGQDAIQAILNYLPTRPNNDEVIFLNQYEQPISKVALWNYWHRHLVRLGLIDLSKNEMGRGNRYGYNLHEMRDVRSGLWEKSPAKVSVCEFTMGHVVDPLGYREKSFRDESWVKREYLKALPYLNIISSYRAFGQVEEERVDGLESRIEEMQRGIDELMSLNELNLQTQSYLSQRLEEHGISLYSGDPIEDRIKIREQLKKALEKRDKEAVSRLTGIALKEFWRLEDKLKEEADSK